MANIYWIAILNVPLGLWMVASCLTRFMLHLQTKEITPNWLAWLTPAGRHTLAMYLGLSALLMLSGRWGLFASQAIWNHTAVWVLALLAFWLVAVSLARAATARQMRDPISRWLAR
jgi:uncharacterized protein